MTCRALRHIPCDFSHTSDSHEIIPDCSRHLAGCYPSCYSTDSDKHASASGHIAFDSSPPPDANETLAD